MLKALQILLVSLCFISCTKNFQFGKDEFVIGTPASAVSNLTHILLNPCVGVSHKEAGIFRIAFNLYQTNYSLTSVVPYLDRSSGIVLLHNLEIKTTVLSLTNPDRSVTNLVYLYNYTLPDFNSDDGMTYGVEITMISNGVTNQFAQGFFSDLETLR